MTRPLSLALAKLVLVPALLLAMLPAVAVAQANHDVNVRRGTGDAVQLWWSSAGPGWAYDVWRSTDPRNVVGGGTLLGTTSLLSFDDTFAHVGVTYYGIHAHDTSTTCVDDAKEDNDSDVAAATPDVGWMWLQRCADDDDWFRVTLAAGERVRAGITYDRDVATLSLELYRAGDVAPMVADPYVVDRIVALAGTYYLRVTGASDAEVAYRMLVEAPFAAPACDIDYASPNQSASEAIPGWPEWTVWSWLQACDGEEDWWTETVLDDSTLDIWVDPFFAISYDLTDTSWYVVELYDADGTTLLESQDTRYGAIWFSRSTAVAQKYYLRIKAYITTNDYWDHVYEKGSSSYPN